MALVNYNGKNILGVILRNGTTVRLLPGINEVADEQLKMMKSHPLFKGKVSSGKVQIMMDNVSEDGKRTIADMLTYIPKIVDVKLLKKIVDTDGRDKVIAAAQAQLDSIKNPAKASAQKEDEHFT